MQQINITLCCIFLLMLFGCKTTDIDANHTNSNDNKYDSEFPSRSVSKELKYISNTVKKLDILAFYATYYFPPNSNISHSSMTDSILDAYSSNMTITHESVSGTASVIYSNNNLIGLLTCAHVIDFSDSIFSYYNNDGSYLQTLSIKIKQQNHITGLPAGEPIEIAAVNKEKDIALLMKKTITTDQKTHILNYPTGKMADLQWGSVVYIMGYPHGNLMVTRAIVSLSDKMKKGIFVTDALYNHGISGSPVFAVRDGVPNFELVGMASSSAAQSSNILVPDEDYKIINKLKEPYNGNIFVENNKLISYGVTYSVSIDEILSFISSNEEALLEKGFDMNSFFK